MVNKIGLNDLKITKEKNYLSFISITLKPQNTIFVQFVGIYTHHKPRSNPNSYCVNAACLEGVNPFELKDVPIFDGINHPHDKK